MIDSWLRSCPYPLGINWTSALEHGIRLINWYLAARLLAFSRTEFHEHEAWLASIYRHCDFIWKNQSRHSSANNHLIGEMAGLYVASIAWPCWPASPHWRSEAKKILERETRYQVHDDGVSREQTVAYQMFVLQFLIIAGLVGEADGDAFSQRYWDTIRRMLTFLLSIRDAAGNLPDFGDSDEGMVFLLSPGARGRRAQDLLDLGALWSAPRDVSPNPDGGASWLAAGFPAPSQWPRDGLTRTQSFPDGGYYVLGCHFGTSDEINLVFDAAPLGYLSIAAHGHADCLSFTLSLGGEPILVDPGTYCYHQDPLWRDYFRSTRAHNTLCVDGMDQSTMAGPFMWTRKARPAVELFDASGTTQRVRASHDGYLVLDDPVSHVRELRLDTAECRLDVLDEIDAQQKHLLQRHWHFSPMCAVHKVSDVALEVRCGQHALDIVADRGTELFVYKGSRAPMAGWVSPRFGELQETFTVCMTNHTHRRTTLRTRLQWRRR